jgi:hypothetical protein
MTRTGTLSGLAHRSSETNRDHHRPDQDAIEVACFAGILTS